ncbi:MAG: AMP-binding protein [Coriobacteriales bacterium]|nr:AMP-binding protein [Coriobacteriales bacterium]
MCGSLLLTGATGFLGSAIAEELVLTTKLTVYALVRAKSGRSAQQRLHSLWYERPTLRDALGTRIIVLQGDIEQSNLGLDRARYDKLAQNVSVVVHAAAEVSVNQSAEHLWNTNVVGTHQVIEFAKRAGELGSFCRLVHISTAYVAGRQQGFIPERIFGDDEYNSLYEQSKHEAELLLSSYEDCVPYAIVRPAQIVGDSRNGFISTFNTLYYPLKRYLQGTLSVIPAAPSLRVNMVPVDYVAHLACKAALAPSLPQGQVINAVGQNNELPTLGELVEEVRLWAHEHLRLDLPKPTYLPLGALDRIGQARNLHNANKPKVRGPVRNMVALAPYFYERRSYEVTNARALADVPFPAWKDYLPHMLAFATRRGFLNQSDRTVYEQILMRLRPQASTHFSFVDVDGQGMKRHTGAEVRRQIEQLAQALMAHGVQGGTRVATLGVNSVRYATLDAAIGLVGAVNVPIYYTSSPEDVQALVQTSGAQLLFVGTARMLEALDPEELGIQIVAFIDYDPLPASVTDWQSFIAAGDKSAGLQPLPYVAPEQLATIRYTSGTTGLPKGVRFTQQQVRWMGEVMPAVLDWRTRTCGRIRYLSFLPMSHVVEGILVAYAPYYILSDVEMYYLNDFSALVETLPKVRPNLFFSVPRFYEKLWNQFAATSAGRHWIGLPEGPQKRLLAAPLRAALLRKAGLDRCRQLIVGSAPIGLDLLESYRSLGIEIHNAFGVTEAPLITLSRLGANELGSVGQPLPDTEIRLDEQGLVYVRGPQVTLGYDNVDELAVDKSAWFCTGDLGSWSASGNLVLSGRQKEILVTSYGKNIAPQKIEVLLKGLDGVSEAMVIADGKPFVTALLWLEDGIQEIDSAALDLQLRRMNERLSHPEQVKRWIVCAEPLTLAAGELTPNLKLRRDEILRTRAELVEILYQDWNSTTFDTTHTNTLHLGRI